MRMNIVSWNINGIRSGEDAFLSFMHDYEPDILMLQEVRAFPEQINLFVQSIPGYTSVFHPAEKAGYSGTAVYYKDTLPVEHVTRLREHDVLDAEGRTLLTKLQDGTHIINTYTPNGTSGAERLEYKLNYYSKLSEYITSLRQAEHPVILGGDLNVAHTEKDLYNPRGNTNHSGFLPSERSWFQGLLDNGFHDTFRLFQQDGEHYSWWHLRDPKRAANRGWRFDYFLVSDDVRPKVTGAEILRDVFGSDHAPVVVKIEV